MSLTQWVIFEGPLGKVEKAPGLQRLLIWKWILLFKVVMFSVNKTQWPLNRKTIKLFASNPSPLFRAFRGMTHDHMAPASPVHADFKPFHQIFEIFVIPLHLQLQLCKVYTLRDSSVWMASHKVCFHPLNVKFSSPARVSRKRPSLQSGGFEAPSPVNAWDDTSFKNRMSPQEMSKWKKRPWGFLYSYFAVSKWVV